MLETKEPILGGGFWIRRVDYSPAVMQGKKKAQPYTPTDNKENTPRGWRRTVALRHRRPGRTPLPEWYPRTPLRDITSILKAYERRRLRIQATQTAAVPLAAGDPLAPLNPPPHLAASAASTTSAKPEKEACPPIKATPQAVELPITPAPPAGRFEEGSSSAAGTASELLNSIDQIEKAVRRNLRRTTRFESKRATQMRSLMSMR